MTGVTDNDDDVPKSGWKRSSRVGERYDCGRLVPAPCPEGFFIRASWLSEVIELQKVPAGRKLR